MKNYKAIVLLSVLSIPSPIYSSDLTRGQSKRSAKIVPRAIYGLDDRTEIFESRDHLMIELSLSTAAQIYNSDILEVNGVFSFLVETNKDRGVCSTERFSNQPANAKCTGFLIATDVLVTAGHCVQSIEDCKNHKWFFDYANTTGIIKEFSFSKDQVFSCVAIIDRKFEQSSGVDYAILRLERHVLGRAPLKFRKNGRITDDALLTVIGHPSGVPTKISSKGLMRDNKNENFFVISSDTYSGNSGSPVIDSTSGLVEGILSKGEADYAESDYNCYKSYIIDQNAGRGEDAVRMTSIKELQNF